MSFQYVSKKTFQLVSSCQSFRRLSREARVGISSSSSFITLLSAFQAARSNTSENKRFFQKSSKCFKHPLSFASSRVAWPRKNQKFLKDWARSHRIRVMLSKPCHGRASNSEPEPVKSLSNKTPPAEPLSATRS